ncbi:MAG: lysophospholipase [Syntrophaceae bacterium]|nr:lysophospholipase [Syntrophaceae bacterium]
MQYTEGIFPEGDGRLDLYFQSWRANQATRAVLVIIHGFGEHSGRYANVVNHLVPQGYAIYGFDLKGHGRSPGQRGHINSWNEYREDVRAFLQMVPRREPNLPIFLLGHSMGALIVLDYILRHPAGLRGAVISGAPLEPVGVAKPFLVLVARVLSWVWPRFSLPLGLDTRGISRDMNVVKAYKADPWVHGKTTVRWGTEILKTIEWVKAHAAEVRIPVLLIHGGSDPLNSPDGTRSFFNKIAFPDKEMKIYSGSYHETHNDLDYRQVMRDITEWLERHLKAGIPGMNR